MAVFQTLFLATVLLLSVVVHKGDGIKCFVCNSAEDSQCAYDEPPNEMLINCTDKKDGTKYTFCRKIVQSIEFAVNNLPPDTRIIRGCGYDESSYRGKCYQRSGFGGRQEVCACFEDGCNSASSIKATIGLLLAAVLAFLIRA